MSRYLTVDWPRLRHDLFRLWLWATRRAACRGCGGWGKVLRLDAGIMHRFGLRWWEGCEACGGDRERVGTGVQKPAAPGDRSASTEEG